MSSDRFASLIGRSPIEFPLSAGRYKIRVSSAGYDPMVIDDVVIDAEKTNKLDPIMLRAGTGSISGLVKIPHSLGEETLSVELGGEGRVPCEFCSRDPKVATRCKECGYEKASTLVALSEGSGFEFGPLAAGHYFLTIRNSRGEVLLGRSFDLAVGQDLVVNLSLRFFDLDVQVSRRFDSDLQAYGDEGELSFEGNWLEEAEAFYEDIQFYFLQQGVRTAVANYKPTKVGRPIFSEETTLRAAPGYRRQNRESFGKRVSKRSKKRPQAKPLPWPSRIDYPRSRDAHLSSSAIGTMPALVPLQLKIQHLRHGVFRIKNIPVGVEQLAVMCGPWMSSVGQTGSIKHHRPSDGPKHILLSRCINNSKVLERSFKNPAIDSNCATCHKDLTTTQIISR